MFLLKDLSNGRNPEVMKFLPGQNQNRFLFCGKTSFLTLQVSAYAISLYKFHF